MIGVIVIGLILDLDSTVRIFVVEFVLKVVLGRPFQCWKGNARRAIPSLLSIFHPQFTPYALEQSHVCKTCVISSRSSATEEFLLGQIYLLQILES